MNFLQIAQFVSDQQDGERLSTVYNPDQGMLSQTVRRLRDNVNRAYNLVKLALGWRNENAETTFTITTAANTESYNIPSGVLTVSQLKIGTDPPVRMLPWPEYEIYKSDTYLILVTGYPDVAAIYGRKVYFYPVPDTAYTVDCRGYETLTRLNLDEDEPDLPADFHQVIAEIALYYEMVYENNPGAGLLVTDAAGNLQGQGGQAANAVLMFNTIKKNFRAHFIEAPRMRSPLEQRRLNSLRRIVRG